MPCAPDAWIVVEKILGADESLPDGWPVDGTTGYRFANLATGLFVDPAGEAAMSAVWASVADAGPGWDEIVGEARVEVLVVAARQRPQPAHRPLRDA